MVKAGRAAEEQMAHYLKRAFDEDTQVQVINHLRLERDGEVAQIDHLVLHRFGVVVVESKSVSGEVRVNAQGEWQRVSQGRTEGMASPVLQGQRQAKFLAKYLQNEGPNLLEKMLGLLQKGYGAMPRDVLVAISDRGVIQRATGLALPEVCKADQVPEKIRAIIASHKKNSNFLFGPVDEAGWSFKESELRNVAAFLLERHRPHGLGTPAAVSMGEGRPSSSSISVTATVTAQAATSPTPASKSKPDVRLAEVVCRQCSSPRVNIVYGKFGYYFKCGACDGNTPIQMTCKTCGKKAKVRKDDTKFLLECGPCGSSILFFVNVADVETTDLETAG